MAYYMVEIGVAVESRTGFRASFETREVSFVPTELHNHILNTDDQFLRALNEIAAHNSFAAIVPADLGGDSFVHRMFNYTTSDRHYADIGIEISLYHTDTVTSEEDTPDETIMQTTTQVHTLATLKLFKCKLQTFTAADDHMGDQSYTIAFKVTGGDKLILGLRPNERSTEVIDRQSYPRRRP